MSGIRQDIRFRLSNIRPEKNFKLKTVDKKLQQTMSGIYILQNTMIGVWQDEKKK